MAFSKLKYRIPGEQVVELKGAFKRLDNPQLFEGFVVSDFSGELFYGFYEGKSDEIDMVWEEPIVIGQEAYCDLANEFIHHLQDHQIGKAILSRIKKVDFSTSNVDDFFHRLEQKYPNAFVYCFESAALGTWIGATPEILLQLEGQRGKTMSLAGTMPTDSTSPWGEKEIHEQQLVTDFIGQQLNSVCDDVNISDRDELIAGPVKHLIHRFDFSISEKNVWNLVKLLHPTPAVSGFPREKALKTIESFEPHNRSFYAGVIGIKSKEKTKLFVNLRMGSIHKNALYLYLGGGLTQASVAMDEWIETENKSKTLVNLIV